MTDTHQSWQQEAGGEKTTLTGPDACAGSAGVANIDAVGDGGARAATAAAPTMLDRLTEINLDDIFDAAGLMGVRHTPLQRLFRPYARRFALVAQEFDRLVGEQGLARGSAWLASRMAAGTQVTGAEQVPAAGPAVVLANHPGMTDAVSLLACLASRPDLLVIALDRPFLRALPHVAQHLILVPGDAVGRLGVVRAGVKHLKQGGALLTFPAGEIEPDPATFGHRQALESVHRWSDSFAVFARRVPQARFIPAVVSHVVCPEAQRHVLTHLRRTAHDKQRLAAALQVALPRYQKMAARVSFGLAQMAGVGDGDALRSAIVEQIAQLIRSSDSPARVGAAQQATTHGAHPPRNERASQPRPLRS